MIRLPQTFSKNKWRETKSLGMCGSNPVFEPKLKTMTRATEALYTQHIFLPMPLRSWTHIMCDRHRSRVFMLIVVVGALLLTLFVADFDPDALLTRQPIPAPSKPADEKCDIHALIAELGKAVAVSGPPPQAPASCVPRTGPQRDLVKISPLFDHSLFYALKPFSIPIPPFSGVGQYPVNDPLPPELAATCSMDSCFDASRCLKQPRAPGGLPWVYIYRTHNKSLGWITEVFDWLRSRPYITEDPEKACIFLPDIPLWCHGNDCHEGADLGFADEFLRNLSLWNGGKNHLLYAENDFSATEWKSLIGLKTTDRAMIVHTNFYPGEVRNAFDIPIPLESRSTEIDWINYRPKPAKDRKLLAGFKGHRYGSCGGPVRDALRWIDDEDVPIRFQCFDGTVDMLCAKDLEAWQKGPGYQEMLADARFGIAVRGCGLHSYRLMNCEDCSIGLD